MLKNMTLFEGFIGLLVMLAAIALIVVPLFRPTLVQADYIACFVGEVPVYSGLIRGDVEISGNNLRFFAEDLGAMVQVSADSCVMMSRGD